ncbi:MAG: ArnT family glycosyltransferase [Hydrogenobaculum sp.]
MTKKEIAIYTILSFYFFFLGNNILSITSPDEGRNLYAASYMLQTGHFLTPMFNCHFRFEKPPMLYWVSDLLFLIFGVHVWLARAVSGISAFIIGIFTYKIAKDIYKLENPFYASLILFTITHLWIESRAYVPEMLLTAFEIVSIYFFLKEKTTLGYIFMGFATLTKGPVGTAVVLMVIISLKRNIKFLKKLIDIKGILLYVVIGWSWYIYMVYKYGFYYIYKFFIRNNIDVYTGQKNIHLYPFYYYIVVLFIALILWVPWFYSFLKKYLNQKTKAATDMLIWSFVVLLFFTLSKNKLHHYIISIYVPISIFISMYASKKLVKFNLILSSILLFVLFILAYRYESERFVPKAVSIIKSKKLPVYYDNAHLSAMVYYLNTCIDSLPRYTPKHYFVISKNPPSKMPYYKLLTKGIEFDGKYYLYER